MPEGLPEEVLDGAPHVIRVLVWAAIGVTCVGIIWKFVLPTLKATRQLGSSIATILGLLHKIAHEVQPNDGKSLKDLVTKSVGQNEEAIRQNAETLEKLCAIERRFDGQIKSLKEENEGIKKQVQALQDQFERFIRHLAANSLKGSMLATEATNHANASERIKQESIQTEGTD
jgi:archaellum component FlaC